MITPEPNDGGMPNAHPLSPEQRHEVDAQIAHASFGIGRLLQRQTIESAHLSAAVPGDIRERIGVVVDTAYPPIGYAADRHPFAIAIERGLNIGYLFGIEFEGMTGQRADRYENYQIACIDAMTSASQTKGPVSPETIVMQKGELFEFIYPMLPLGELYEYPTQVSRIRHLFVDSVAHMATNSVSFLVAETVSRRTASSRLKIGLRAAQLQLRPNNRPFTPVHDVYSELPPNET